MLHEPGSIMASRLCLCLNVLSISFIVVLRAVEVIPTAALEQKRSEKHHSNILDALMAKMEPRVRPNSGGPPTVVECDMFIMSFGSISEFDMDYTVDIHLRQQWKDTRLAFTGTSDPLILNRRLINKVWTPDLYFPYEKRASFHNVPVPNKRMQVYPNGTVQYSYRITLTVSCPMELSRFALNILQSPKLDWARHRPQQCPLEYVLFGV